MLIEAKTINFIPKIASIFMFFIVILPMLMKINIEINRGTSSISSPMIKTHSSSLFSSLAQGREKIEKKTRVWSAIPNFFS
jgi:hypothetical protein